MRAPRSRLRPVSYLTLGLGLLLMMAPARAQSTGSAAPGAKPDTVKWIGVWEPVNFAGDLALRDAHFATPDEGWVAGGVNEMAGGVILHTKDAGADWEVELGDPGSSDREYGDLRFDAPRDGFAVQRTSGGDYKLLHTSGDGWTVSGTIAQHFTDYAFISPTTGFVGRRPGILRTDDGGRTWKTAFECRATVQVQGLTRQASCDVSAFSFPSARTGYALAASNQAPGVFVLKTTDGGATWSVSVVLPEESGEEAHVAFTNEQNGVACLRDGKLERTADGGTTWSEIPGPSCDGEPRVAFAGGVGWALVYRQWDFSTNGGRRWVSRTINFPADVNAFTLTRADRGYAVGDHGMIYRYSVVPDTAKLRQGTIRTVPMPR